MLRRQNVGCSHVPRPQSHLSVFVLLPAAVGVPDTTPVLPLRTRPAGSPDAVQVYVPVPPEACRVRLAEVPTVPVWLAGAVTVTGAGAGAVAAAKAAVPFGLPRPVGPSHPVPAVQIGGGGGAVGCPPAS